MSGVQESVPQKTFYLETFGCQMNVHDSEKVVGTLLQEGYRQVQTVEQADLILYNTCSIRDKAEQKVFHRLADFKKLQAEGKKFGVLGCVAQQEGEKIFERAPHVSLVCGSASYRNLPEMLAQLESVPAGKRERRKVETETLVRITGLDDRQTDKCFETEFTARTNPHRGYITIIEGCDKFCAYCVVPFTRGKERSDPVTIAGAKNNACSGRKKGKASMDSATPYLMTHRRRILRPCPCRGGNATITLSTRKRSNEQTPV
jgi:tRNA-2-methylthio-N6-dimethylallyladenosine synthase